MNKNLLPIMLCVFSLNVFSEQNNQMYTLHQNNLFKNDSVIQNKNLTLSTKQIGKFSSFYLDNGLKVILLPFENIEKTGVYLTSRVGSKHEGYGETGMAHLLEHMLFKNTHNISDIKKELTNLGAEWNGFTSPEQTTFHEVFNNDKDNNKLNKILELESERFFNATFTKDDLDKEMSVVRNELERNESSPETLLWNETLNKSFDWHGYKHPTIGEKSDIENAPFYKLQDFYKKYYQPKNSFLIVFGNFNSSDIKPLIEKHFNKYQNINDHILNNWTQEPFSAKNSITTLYTSDNINASNIVWKAPNFIYDNRAVSASLVFSSISQKPYGIFYKKYILKKDKNTNFITDIDTSILPLNDYAPFIVQVEQVVEGNKFPQKNIDLITTDIESLSLFNQTNFNQLKEDILKKYKELESSPQSMVNSFLKYESMGDWSLYFSNKELVKNSSFDDGIDYLKEYITPYNRTVVNIMKDSKLKNNSYYKNIKTLNQTHYNNQKIDYINETKEKPVDFTFESIPTFEPSLENLKNNTQHISFSNKNIEIKTAFIKKQTLGDYVYFSLSNKFGNTLLNTKYRDNCSLLGIVPALGGTNYSREELDKIMKKYEATYSLNFNSISLKVKKEYFIETLNILFDVLKNPSFDELEFESIKKSNINSLESNLSNQNVLNSEFLIKKITPYDINSPLFKLSSKETLEVLKKHTVNDLKMCYNIFKGATNTNISILGNVSKEDIEKSLQSYYSWTPNYIYNMVENSKIKDFNNILKENNNESTFILHDSDKPNSFNIKLVQLPIDITNPDYPKLKAAISIFGDSSNSRLFKSLREKNGLSYTATANMSGNYFFKKTPVSIYVISSVNNADKANQLIQDTWNEFLTKGITEDELVNFKENIINAKKLSLSEDTNLVNFNLDRISNNKDIEFYIDFYDQINNLTVNDINNSIKKWFKDIRFITVYNK